MRIRFLFLICAAAAAQTPAGEVTTRDETPTFQSSVNLVRVPVVVRDKKGNPVGTLHKEDFQVTDRGKPQYISQFAMEGGAVPKPAAQPATAEDTSAAPGAPGSTLVLPKRFTAFVVDDVHLKSEDLANVRLALLKHVEHGLQADQRAALLTLSGKVSLEFTSDMAKFRETLMKIMPAPTQHQSFPPATFFVADQWMNRDDRQALALQTAVTIDCLHLDGPAAASAAGIAQSSLREAANMGSGEAINAFRTLNNIVRLLGSMPGDRIIILASPGMYLPDDLQRDLSESIDRATRSGVIINTLDGRGVYTIDPTGDVPGCRLSSPQTQMLVAKYDNFANSAQGMILHDLADATGGTAVADNDLAGGLNRLANPPEYVYYLGFYPKELKPDGKFHEIKVKLADGKGLTIQARKGYWAPSHEEDAASAAVREISEAVFSHDELHDLPVDVHTQFYKTNDAEAKLKVTTHLDIRQLPLRKAEDRNRDDITLVCALFDTNGNYIQGTQKTVELRLKDENLERRRTLGVTVNADFDVKVGAYMIRVVARDAEGKEMAASNGVVEIP